LWFGAAWRFEPRAIDYQYLHHRTLSAGTRLGEVAILIRWTDAMIGELEEDNLRDVRQVSGAWFPRLANLFSVLPFGFRPWLPARPTPTEVMDVLYDAQQNLFDIKKLIRRSCRDSAECPCVLPLWKQFGS
jgi:hypothetical protein